jgi:molybdopterin molybdotransferase
VTPAKQPIAWSAARDTVYAAGVAVVRGLPAENVPIAEADGRTLAQPLVTLTDLPAFPTSSVDGWAVRGTAPWRRVGRVLAGELADALTEDGTCVEIATGAMVPEGTATILRVEDSSVDGEFVDGTARAAHEWRDIGEEAALGEELIPAGTAVTPGLIGLAAACGYDTLKVTPELTGALLVFGDELLMSGPPQAGRVRDALGPSVPAFLTRLGVRMLHQRGPVEDTLDAHVEAIRGAVAAGARLICTTGGTMHGPVDHLHPALAKLGAEYVVNTVAVRPGYPMLVAKLPGGQFVAGLPGNPQSTMVAISSLVEPLLAGLAGRRPPFLPTVRLGTDIPGRGEFTHLALVRRDAHGLVHPVGHAGSSMLRGLAQSIGFAVVLPGTSGQAGDEAPLVPLPLLDGERP